MRALCQLAHQGQVPQRQLPTRAAADQCCAVTAGRDAVHRRRVAMQRQQHLLRGEFRVGDQRLRLRGCRGEVKCSTPRALPTEQSPYLHVSGGPRLDGAVGPRGEQQRAVRGEDDLQQRSHLACACFGLRSGAGVKGWLVGRDSRLRSEQPACFTAIRPSTLASVGLATHRGVLGCTG